MSKIVEELYEEYLNDKLSLIISFSDDSNYSSEDIFLSMVDDFH